MGDKCNHYWYDGSQSHRCTREGPHAEHKCGSCPDATTPVVVESARTK